MLPFPSCPSRVSSREAPLYIGVHDEKDEATVDHLEQGYVVTPLETRFRLLFTFLKLNRKKKVFLLLSCRILAQKLSSSCLTWSSAVSTPCVLSCVL